jgi:D-alanyl-D-alanine carboxypeptidase
MNRSLILVPAFLLAGLLSYSQPLQRAKLDSLFTALSNNNLAMASIAVSKNGHIIYQRSIGNASNTQYHIGSITKMFTAVIIFQLLEEKKLSINDTLGKFFPALPNAGLITIGNMLNHRSGLHNFTDGTNYPDWMDKSKTHEELLVLISNRKPDFAPSAKADYNNSNYLVLSYIIERICRKPYKVVLNERIISKLALKNTYYGNDSSNKNECFSYKYFDNKWSKEKSADLNNFCGAGAIVSTPADMTKFIEGLFGYKLINKESLHTMTTLVDGYGMGIFPYSFQSKKGFGHNGKTEGFASSLTYYPEDKLAIAYCTNGEVYPKADILDGVLSIYFNAPYKVPSFISLQLTAQQLDQYIGTYTSEQPAIKVVCTKSNTGLGLETQGHSFAVDAVAGDTFINRQFGFVFEFDLANKQLMIIEGGVTYYLKKAGL